MEAAAGSVQLSDSSQWLLKKQGSIEPGQSVSFQDDQLSSSILPPSPLQNILQPPEVWSAGKRAN